MSSSGGEITDYQDILGILIAFKDNSAYPTAGTELNNTCSSDLPNYERLFTNPGQQDDVLADTQLGNTLRQAIVDNVIMPSATATANANDIHMKIILPLCKSVVVLGFLQDTSQRMQ